MNSLAANERIALLTFRLTIGRQLIGERVKSTVDWWLNETTDTHD